MSKIREFIDIMARHNRDLNEAFMSPPQRPFGRKGIGEPPTDQDERSRLATAKRYPTADAYARDNSQLYPGSRSDPPDLRQRIQKEFQGLVDEWTRWKNAGLI